jgi:NAD(P)-dependent dehydrogenase (short-subunit alcohol dehydrogenase family)
MNPTYDFTGRVAFVTGAGSGMGLATARAFAEAGAAVTLADVDDAQLEAAERELRDSGHRALAVRCDVADEDQIAAAVATTVQTFGSLDLAYNNAGIQSPMTDAADETAKVFDRVNAINLRGIWASMKHELAQMRIQGSGAIVNCSSLSGLLVTRWARRAARPSRLSRIQTRCHRPDPQRRTGIRSPGHPDQRHLPRHHGLTQQQASEALTQLAFYAGWPKVFSALPVVKDVFTSRPA